MFNEAKKRSIFELESKKSALDIFEGAFKGYPFREDSCFSKIHRILKENEGQVKPGKEYQVDLIRWYIKQLHLTCFPKHASYFTTQPARASEQLFQESNQIFNFFIALEKLNTPEGISQDIASIKSIVLFRRPARNNDESEDFKLLSRRWLDKIALINEIDASIEGCKKHMSACCSATKDGLSIFAKKVAPYTFYIGLLSEVRTFLLSELAPDQSGLCLQFFKIHNLASSKDPLIGDLNSMILSGEVYIFKYSLVVDLLNNIIKNIEKTSSLPLHVPGLSYPISC
jgi:hypothetical protein